MATAILRLPAVKARTGLSRSTIYLRISEGRFPKAVSLSGRAGGYQATPKTSKKTSDFTGLGPCVKGCIVTLALWGGLRDE